MLELANGKLSNTARQEGIVQEKMEGLMGLEQGSSE
jgi:hypothetical protein